MHQFTDEQNYRFSVGRQNISSKEISSTSNTIQSSRYRQAAFALLICEYWLQFRRPKGGTKPETDGPTYFPMEMGSPVINYGHPF
jgi:hypothetical protein